MLRIGIDGRPLQGDIAGTGRYTIELCRVLHDCLPGAEFVLYSNRPIEKPVASNRWQVGIDGSGLLSRLPAAIWYSERVGKLAQRDSIDVFWGTANFLPRGIGHHCKTVLTVLDLVPELYAETMGWRHRLAYKLYFKQSLKQSDRLVTISKGTSHRLAQIFGRHADSVIYPCAGSQFFVPSEQDIARVRRTYGLQQKFLLAVCTIEPRKNLGSLLQALIELRTEDVELPTLVLVGQTGWKAGDILSKIDKAQAAGVHIVQTGFVPDEDLPALYAGSSAFIFPSVYEGFGMPVLEALKCGAQVLASDVPEIREAGGSSATYFEASVSGIKAAIKRFLQSDAFLRPDPNRFNRAVDHGSTWEEEGSKLAKVMKSLT